MEQRAGTDATAASAPPPSFPPPGLASQHAAGIGSAPPPVTPAHERISSPTTSDYLFAGVALVLVGPLWSVAGGQTDGALAMVVGAVTAVVMPVALIWRRSHPAASTAVIYVAALLHFVAGALVTPADLLIFVSLYSTTAFGPVWAQRTALAGALLGSFLQAVGLYSGFMGWGIGALDAVFVTLLMTAAVATAWALGLVRRARFERQESHAERAARLEIERDQQAQLATAAERARIAREMHDVVAHSLSVVISQADGGRYAAAADPKAAERALETIAESGRTALTDLRRILGVLRDGDDDTALTPQPDEHNLDDLLNRVREAGLNVSLVRIGDAQPLPAAVGLALYRIVQESLTNVMKYAGPAAVATVLLRWADHSLHVVVEDNGRGAAASQSGGHGLVGMRERATMLGGNLSAGPRPGGGWRVSASIPLTLPRTS